MKSVRIRWLMPIAVGLLLAAGSCRKGSTEEDASGPAAEPTAEEEAPAKEAPPERKPGAAPAQPAAQAPATPAAPEGAPAPAPAPAPVAAGPKTALPDPRLLLTLKDVQDLAKGRTAFRRSALQGVPTDDDSDAILYEPEKGTSYGAALQVFRGRSPDAARERFVAMLASYPSAQEISPVAGRTFFAYWEEILYVGFIVPARNLVVVVSCGRKFCDSDTLYELAKKVGTRTNG